MEGGGSWRGKWRDMSPQGRRACGEIVPEKYCIRSVKAWKHRWFFFSLMVVASEGAARLRWKMAVPIVSLGIRYLEPLLNGGGGAMGRGL